MRIYNKPTRKKRTTRCSYCGGLGHLWITCVYPKQHLDQVNRGEHMDLTIFQGNQAKWAFRLNKETGLLEPRTQWLIENATEYLTKQISRNHSRSISKKVTVRRCGFCNSPSHNRKNCKLMKDFINDLAEANSNYRQQFFDVLVGYHGIAEGALVEIRKGGARDYGKMEKQIAIIQSIDWDSINITLDVTDRRYSGDVEFSVISDGELIKSRTPFWYWLDESHVEYSNRRLNHYLSQHIYDDKFQILHVLSQSDNKPSQNWFVAGYDNAWEWVCKNRSLSEIGSVFAGVIEKWCPVLKAKRGLEARLKRYRKK